MNFQTSDGLELTFKNGKWCGGNLVFDSHLTGKDEQWPVDKNGEPLYGCHICPEAEVSENDCEVIEGG